MSNQEETIRHPGLVDHIDGNHVFVKIMSQSACSTCHAKAMCSIAEVEEKIVEVIADNPGQLKKGEMVMVAMKKSLGGSAVFLGYILPLIILVAALVVFIKVTGNEGLSALISLALLVPYYLILFKLKDRLKNKFSFRLERGEA